MDKAVPAVFLFSILIVMVYTNVTLLLLQSESHHDSVKQIRDLISEDASTQISLKSTSAPIVFRCETRVEAELENTGKLTIRDFGRHDVILDYVSTAGSPVAHRFNYVVGNILRDQWTFASTTSDNTTPSEWHPTEVAFLTSRLNTQPKPGTWGYLTVATANGVSDSGYVDFQNAVSADCRYLHNNPTPPVADTAAQTVLPMDGELPTAAVLYDYDTPRDSLPGLVLDKTAEGLAEIDPPKFQRWRSGALAGDLPITGTVLLDVWGAIKDFATGVGAITVFLRDFDPIGPSHTEITNGTVFARDWQEGASDFVERMALVLGTNYTVLAGHELEAWVVVDNESVQSMRLSYDTNARPSVINLSYVPPVTSSLLYLHNNPFPPTGDTDSQATLPLSFTAPTTATLYNYDLEREGFPGLQINKGTGGVGEIDPAKFQVWRTNALESDWPIKGDVLVDIWMGLKDFALDKRGVITLYLRDFDPTLSMHTEIGLGSHFDIDWQGGLGTWVKQTILVASLSYTVPAGHMLEAKLTVENQSSDAMWVAYDTTLQPTVMNFPSRTAVPVFKTNATLTVLDGYDEKNDKTFEEDAKTFLVQTSDDQWLITEGTFYTSYEFTDVAIPANATITSATIYVEHHEEADFEGTIQWKVGTGWGSGGPQTEWGNIPATLRVGSETEDTWDVTTFVNTATRVSDMELVIQNNTTNGKKTNADYVYVIVQWDEP